VTSETNSGDTAVLSHEVRDTHAQPAYAMIWLHGLGADGYDFMPVAQAMPATAAHRVRYVFPHAPTRPVTINNGMVMRAWYDIMGFDLRRDQDRGGIENSVKAVETLRDHLARQGIPYQRQIIAGFSQGGVIALRTALASQRPPLAVVGLSCYLADPESLTQWAAPDATQVPVFLGHGTQDPVVPVQLGERALAALQEARYAVAWHTYPIPHAVSPQEIGDIDAWIAQQITARQAA